MLYPGGGIAYIDALFQSSGAATQSGLNTINFNDLLLYQQIVLYFIGMIGNPIWINSFVVFVRLYWFEKRFQHIVREARTVRRTGTKSRTKSEARDDADIEAEERGVNGRPIVVLRNGHNANGHAIENDNEKSFGVENPMEDTDEGSQSPRGGGHSPIPRTGSSDSGSASTLPQAQSFHRDITFADEVKPVRRTDTESSRLPEPRSAEQHIAFLENQRNPADKGTLRIPGPREFDRGDLPKQLDNEEGQGNGALARQTSGPVEQVGADEDKEGNEEFNSDDHPAKGDITIDEPDHPPQSRSRRFSRLNIRRNSTINRSLPRPPSFNTQAIQDRARTITLASINTFRSQDRERDPAPYLSYQPTIGRNSAFVDLTEEQREELGGIEYRALKTLAMILIIYFVGFHLFGLVCLTPWIRGSKRYGDVVKSDGQNRIWWGIFTAATLFNDVGFTLTPDSMMSFQYAVFPLLVGSFLIVIGNTGFPCMLRFMIWFASKIFPRDTGVWEELRFLLDHPRRCFTLLFPRGATWWLFLVLVVLNAIDLIFFNILDLHNSPVSVLPAGIKVLDGLFQAVSVRTAGLSVVNIGSLHPGTQVSYLIMMYISVFPVAISMRRTNVYEEQSLGIYKADMHDDADDEDGVHKSYLGAHLRRQLSFDFWYIFLGLFIIAIAEGDKLASGNSSYSLFSVLFEIVSAYGTVGLSLGYPTTDMSFSSQFNVISKLVIIAMQIRGRHRGLPYELDRAILLPSESLHKAEDEDARARARRASSVSQLDVNRDDLDMHPTGVATTGRDGTEGPLAGGSGAYGSPAPGRARRPSGVGSGLGRVLSGGLGAGPTMSKRRWHPRGRE
ncbi:MAG: hypothetical protein M1819_006894 [Sarea resinae]|nr:MAG: hypothetical protein M1819_006894 [Sarea resinae]